MQPGYKLNQVVEPVPKTEDQVKQEREEFWESAREELKSVNIDQMVIKQNQGELFGLEITSRLSYDM